MTQTTDDFSNSSSSSTENTSKTCTFTCTMDHSKEGEKGTATIEASTLEEERDLGASVAPEMATKPDEGKQFVLEDRSEKEKGALVTGISGPTTANGESGSSAIISSSATPIISNSTAAVAEFSGADVITPSDIMNISASSGSADTGQFSKAPMCAICSEPCICYCKSCKKVCYCSKEHQKKHWKTHRPECYPVVVQVNSVFGSHLVVTRDVKRGEVILREKPLVSGPFLNHVEAISQKESKTCKESGRSCGVARSSQSACLTCHKIIRRHDDGNVSPSSMVSCSKCGWPICCQDCEKNPTHAEQECKIFAEYQVEPSALCDMDAQYLCVALLRILLKKRTNTISSISITDSNDHDAKTTTNNESIIKWTKFMEVVNKQMPMKDGLNSQLAEAMKATARFSDLITKSLGSIIRQEFSVTEAEIDQIVRTLRTSSFITDTDGNYINGFFGRTLSMNNNGDLGHYYCSSSAPVCIGQDERSNIVNADDEDTECNLSRCFPDKGKCLSVYHLASMITSNCIPNASWIIQDSLDFYLRASAPIKTGERITITFVDPLLGTWERRERLWQEKYLSCSCSRCSDPTESCTFFSAIKCPEKKAEDGKNSYSGSECEGYILPTDPLAVTYTSWEFCRTSCFCEFDAATQETKLESDSICYKLQCDENSIPGFSTSHAFTSGGKLGEKSISEWRCNVCLMRQPWGFVQNSLQRLRANSLTSKETLKQIPSSAVREQQDICFTTTPNLCSGNGGCNTMPQANTPVGEEVVVASEPEDEVTTTTVEIREKKKCKDLLENLELRADKIDNFVRNVAHANHYDILKMENELLTGISKLLETGQIPFEEMEKWALKMMELCKKGLKVVNILCPGLSRERGRLLYFLQQSLVISLLFKTSRAMRIINSKPGANGTDCTNLPNKESLTNDELMKKFQEILLARKEVLEIFAICKENSEESKMLQAVQHDSIEIRLLKNYFKYHQNTYISLA